MTFNFQRKPFVAVWLPLNSPPSVIWSCKKCITHRGSSRVLYTISKFQTLQASNVRRIKTKQKNLDSWRWMTCIPAVNFIIISFNFMIDVPHNAKIMIPEMWPSHNRHFNTNRDLILCTSRRLKNMETFAIHTLYTTLIHNFWNPFSDTLISDTA